MKNVVTELRSFFDLQINTINNLCPLNETILMIFFCPSKLCTLLRCLSFQFEYCVSMMVTIVSQLLWTTV